MDIAIGAGHSSNCRGAIGNGYDEHDEAVRCVSYFIKLCKAHGITAYDCHDDSYGVNTNLEKQVALANAHDVDLAIQWHFNSVVDPTSTGTEVFYYKGSAAGKSTAAAVSKKISGILKLADRGEKSNALYWTSNTDATAILIETCFISNPNDMKSYENNFTKLIEGVFETITGIAITPTVSASTLLSAAKSVHMAPYDKGTNRNKWEKIGGKFKNVATHTYLDIKGNNAVSGSPVRVSTETVDWEYTEGNGKDIDKYINLSPVGSGVSLTRLTNNDGSGVKLLETSSSLLQKFTAVWTGDGEKYYLIGTGTMFLLTVDKE